MRLKRVNLNNLHFDGPELWENQDWTGKFRHQREVFLAIRAWKTEYDQEIERQIAKEEARKIKQLERKND